MHLSAMNMLPSVHLMTTVCILIIIQINLCSVDAWICPRSIDPDDQGFAVKNRTRCDFDGHVGTIREIGASEPSAMVFVKRDWFLVFRENSPSTPGCETMSGMKEEELPPWVTTNDMSVLNDELPKHCFLKQHYVDGMLNYPYKTIHQVIQRGNTFMFLHKGYLIPDRSDVLLWTSYDTMDNYCVQCSYVDYYWEDIGPRPPSLLEFLRTH